MNNIIRKYKDVDMQMQSSRKQVKIQCIFFILILCMIIWAILLFNVNDNHIGKPSLYPCLIVWLVFFCFILYNIDWTIKTGNDTLFIKRWIFKYNIPYRDLLDIQSKWWWDKDNVKRYFLEIRYLQIDYFLKTPFLKFEYMNKDNIIEFINIFLKGGEPIEGVKESNVLLSEYKDIRTKQEEKEIDDFLNKKNKNEQIVMWIIFCALICMMVGFFIWIFNTMN